MKTCIASVPTHNRLNQSKTQIVKTQGQYFGSKQMQEKIKVSEKTLTWQKTH